MSAKPDLWTVVSHFTMVLTIVGTLTAGGWFVISKAQDIEHGFDVLDAHILGLADSQAEFSRLGDRRDEEIKELQQKSAQQAVDQAATSEAIKRIDRTTQDTSAQLSDLLRALAGKRQTADR